MEDIIEAEVSAIRSHSDGVLIEVRLRPGSSRRKVEGISGEAIVISVHNRPIEGKANLEMLRLLAEILRMPASRLEITKGQKSRRKTILARGMTRDEVTCRLFEII